MEFEERRGRFWQGITDDAVKEKAQAERELGKELVPRNPHSCVCPVPAKCRRGSLKSGFLFQSPRRAGYKGSISLRFP